MSESINVIKSAFKNSATGVLLRGLIITLVDYWPFLLFTGAAYLGGYTMATRGEGHRLATVIILGVWSVTTMIIQFIRQQDAQERNELEVKLAVMKDKVADLEFEINLNKKYSTSK